MSERIGYHRVISRETASRLFHTVFDHIRHDPTPKNVQESRDEIPGQLELDFDAYTYAEADVAYIIGSTLTSSLVSPPIDELSSKHT